MQGEVLSRRDFSGDALNNFKWLLDLSDQRMSDIWGVDIPHGAAH